MDYKSFFNKELQKFKDQGLYRNFKEIDRPINKFPKADEIDGDITRDVEVWCTNDYLNMSQHPEVVNETVKTLLEIGTGSGGAWLKYTIRNQLLYFLPPIQQPNQPFGY